MKNKLKVKKINILKLKKVRNLHKDICFIINICYN